MEQFEKKEIVEEEKKKEQESAEAISGLKISTILFFIFMHTLTAKVLVEYT